MVKPGRKQWQNEQTRGNEDFGEQFIEEAHRVLRPAASFLLSSPYPKHGVSSGNPYHVHEYRPEEMQNILERHFILDEVLCREVDTLIVHYFRCHKSDPSNCSQLTREF